MSNTPPSGPGNVGEYQISGIPYIVSGTVSASIPVQFTLPFVSRDIYFRNRGTQTLIIGFSRAGVLGSARFTLNVSESISLPVRTKEIFFNATSGSTFYEAVASLTRIPANNFPALTSSEGFTGV